MADWFKFYENDLDETRLQYAISKLPEVVSVWVGILSEACRHKSGTISWGDDSIELFGFARRLGLTIPKVNEGVSLLCEIRYITRLEGKINVLKWNDKQSEYCQKKAKLKAASTDSVGTVSGQCRPRGEERRGDKREDNNGAHEIPSEEEAVALTMTAGVPDKFSRYVYQDWSSRSGKDAGGVIVDFLPYVTKRWSREQVEWKSNKHKGQANAKPEPIKSTPPPKLKGSQQDQQTLKRMAAQLEQHRRSL